MTASNNHGQDWKFIEGELMDVTAKFKDLGESKLAEICGYFFTDEGGKKTVLLDQYLEALNNYRDYEGCSEHENYYLINDRIVVPDGEHFGFIYIPKRCILADPDFYDIKKFQDFDDEDEEFEEPMMEKNADLLLYLDSGKPVSFEDELQFFGCKPEDVDGRSTWHDG